MKQVEERYISLLTDFGFKRIFGTAMNKDLLICFLNSLFNGRQVVKDVSYHKRFLPAYDRTQSVKFKKQQPRSI